MLPLMSLPSVCRTGELTGEKKRTSMHTVGLTPIDKCHSGVYIKSATMSIKTLINPLPYTSRQKTVRNPNNSRKCRNCTLNRKDWLQKRTSWKEGKCLAQFSISGRKLVSCPCFLGDGISTNYGRYI